MKVAYIAGPYRGKSERAVVENIRHAEKYALKDWQMGYAVICPHLNTQLFGGLAPDEVWLDGDLEILRRCDLCVMIPGWDNSSGARAERVFALEHGIEVRYEID